MFWVLRAYLWSKEPCRLVLILLCGTLRKPFPLNSGQKEEVDLTVRKKTVMQETLRTSVSRLQMERDDWWPSASGWGHPCAAAVGSPSCCAARAMSSSIAQQPGPGTLILKPFKHAPNLSTSFVHEDECGQMSLWEQRHLNTSWLLSTCLSIWLD